MKQYILTGESAEKFMGIKDHNEKKLKERIDNMSKVKVSKAVANFIDEYSLNVSCWCDDWKSKLLITHCFDYSRGYDGTCGKASVLKDITPMKLAEIIHNGYEVVEYTEENLPKIFKFKVKDKDIEYTAISVKGNVSVGWSRFNSTQSITYSIDSALSYLNNNLWAIIEE